MLEQQRAEAAVLELVGHDERHLGIARAGDAVVAADRHDPVLDQRDEGHPVAVVDVGEPLDLPGRQLGVRVEEPEVDGPRREPPVELHEPGGIAWADGAHVDRATVPGEDVALPPLEDLVDDLGVPHEPIVRQTRPARPRPKVPDLGVRRPF